MTKSKKPKWKNTTDWSDRYLRRMLSWVCKELELPRTFIRRVEFGNRKTATWSGWASDSGRILVRIGPASHFPRKSNVFRDGFTAGVIADRVEALVYVTAHEAAHCDNARRGNRSRGNGRSRSNCGSERLTDGMAVRVLKVFREKRAELTAAWDKAPEREAKPVESVIAKRAAHAADMVKKWERRAKAARTKLKAWQRKVAYYERKYPNGEYPEPGNVKRKPAVLKPETGLRRKLSQYLTLALREAGVSRDIEFWEFDGALTRPHEDYEWRGDFTTVRDVRKRVQFGDELEVSGEGRYGRSIGEPLLMPPDEASLDDCLKRGETYRKPQPVKAAATHS